MLGSQQLGSTETETALDLFFFAVFLFRLKPLTMFLIVQHFRRQYITILWYLSAILTERGHKVVG